MTSKDIDDIQSNPKPESPTVPSSGKGDVTPEQRIARRMRDARRRLSPQGRGVSQSEVARRLNVTLRTYARWERAETTGFMSHISAIAKALETTPEQLLGGERELQPPKLEELSKQISDLAREVRNLRRDLGRD